MNNFPSRRDLRLPSGIVFSSQHHAVAASWLSDTWWRLDLSPLDQDPFGPEKLARLDTCWCEGHIEISDLTGTGPGSSFHRRGVAALLFAGWLHFVRQQVPASTLVKGEVLVVADPDGQDRRINFWRRQGFQVRPAQPGHRMEARIGDLRPSLRSRPVLDFAPPADWVG